jgi:hypothetical protein
VQLGIHHRRSIGAWARSLKPKDLGRRTDAFFRYVLSTLLIQLPLMVFAVGMLAFRFSAQGLALESQPLVHPWASRVVVVAVSGMVMLCWLLTLSARQWDRARGALKAVSPAAAGVLTGMFGLALVLGITFHGTWPLVSLALGGVIGLAGHATDRRREEQLLRIWLRAQEGPEVAFNHLEQLAARWMSSGRWRRQRRAKRLRRQMAVIRAQLTRASDRHPRLLQRQVLRTARAHGGLDRKARALLRRTLAVYPQGLIDPFVTHGRWLGGLWAAMLTAYAVILIGAGLYVATQHTEWFELVGPEVAVYAGLAGVCILLQTLFVIIPLALGSWLWPTAMVAGFLACVFFQDKLNDRPNPLLETARQNRQIQDPVPPLGAVADAVECPSAPCYLISAEGGGMRAAYWTAVLLQRLAEREGPGFAARVRLLSGVSGGSVGIATWVAAQELPAAQRISAIQQFLSQDFLTPLVAGLLFVDVPRLVLPVSWLGLHRGDLFEEALARRWQSQTGSDFFYRRVSAIELPGSGAAIYFNATDALSGAAVTLGNRLALPVPGASAPNVLNRQVQAFLQGVRVAQAAHTSARFVYLSPHPDLVLPGKVVAAGMVPPPALAASEADRATRAAALVDGGYFDNSGLGPVIQYLRRNAVNSSDWKVIHIVNDQQRACATYRRSAVCAGWSHEQLEQAQKAQPWAWLTRPIDAILAVRGEHGLQRLNELHQLKPDVRPIELPPPAAEATLLEPQAPVADRASAPVVTAQVRHQPLGAIALGWWLGVDDVRDIDGAASQAAGEWTPRAVLAPQAPSASGAGRASRAMPAVTIPP